MSWSASVKCHKVELEDAVESLFNEAMKMVQIQNVTEEELLIQQSCFSDQIRSAQQAAYELAKIVPGPNVSINISGHANGIGCQSKSGWSNDFVSVSVIQALD